MLSSLTLLQLVVLAVLTAMGFLVTTVITAAIKAIVEKEYPTWWPTRSGLNWCSPPKTWSASSSGSA